MPSKTKKSAKSTSAKSSLKTKKTAAAKAVAKKTVKKPVAKKAVAKKIVTKKTVAKKVVKKAAVKKAVAKKVVKKVAAKKPVVKKTVKKAVAKKVVKKVAAKKAVAKKVASKKTAKITAKKPVAKKTVKKTAIKKPVVAAKAKTAVKKPVAKSTSKSVASAAKTEKAKKPLAPSKGSKVKASSARYHITPIKAPVMVAPQPKLKQVAKTEMTLPIVPPDYEPSDSEEFMNPVMREYFRQRLIAWRDELLRESEETLNVLSEEGNMQKPDIADRASEETDLAIEFRVRDRERKLINKINEALQRIEDSSYGYCDETGDPIPVKRLIAYPTVSMTVEARELHERRERTQRDTYE